jgi:hypothetical protein
VADLVDGGVGGYDWVAMFEEFEVEISDTQLIEEG